MAESESGQEKTEQATPKKLEQAMESGQFARSKEVNTLGLIIGAMLVLTIMAPKMVETLQFFMSSIFQQLATLRMTPESFVGYFGHFMLTAGTLILPVMLMALFAALLCAGAQSGMRVSPKAIEPKFTKLNPLNGFKRMFSSESFAKLAVSLMKFVVIFGFTYPVIKEVLNDPIFYTSTDIQHQYLHFDDQRVDHVSSLALYPGWIYLCLPTPSIYNHRPRPCFSHVPGI